MKLADNNDMHKISDKFENGSDRTNDDRVVPLIVKIACKHSTDHVFSFIIFKLSHSGVLDKMSDRFETRSCGSRHRSLIASYGVNNLFKSLHLLHSSAS